MKHICVNILAAALAVGLTGTALAADHMDSPIVKNDPAADITDTFAFVNPKDPSETILITNVVPMATSNSRFSDQVDYIFHVDNGSSDRSITCTFLNMATRFSCTGPAGVSASGPLNQTVQGQNMRV